MSDIFNKMADFLEIKGANVFRVRAYRNAAININNLSKNLNDMLAEGEELQDIKGIGKDLASKIKEIIETGSLKELEDLQNEFPSSLMEILKLPGLGPKRVKILYQDLKITSIDELENAAKKEKIRKLSGFGEKTEEKILKAIKEAKENNFGERFLLSTAKEIIEKIIAYLEEDNAVEKITVAGSYRRYKETIGDLDILVISKENRRVIKRFIEYSDVKEVLSRGETKSSIILYSGMQVDLRVLDQESFGAALLYFTGSKEHNVALRRIAQEKGLKINEYGVYKKKEKLAGETEESVYSQLDMPFIIPELRQNKGEIEAAQEGKLPEVLQLNDIKSDLHMHTDASDGRNTLREMLESARELGYEYIAISDHSKRVSVANGLDEERLERQIEKIDKIIEEYNDIRILKAIEVDILKDGSLDLPDRILEKLDIRVCSTHFHRNLSRKEQTVRILRAMENPYFNILAHPSGRLLGERNEIDVDMDEVMKAAKENGCYLEINANPRRLDLSAKYARLAKEMSLKLVISTDAHSQNELKNMSYGVAQARRAFLEKDDILNTLNLQEFLQTIKR
ncbi:DNA polymerase/3'-5' exonuclease PolX [Natronospora cellulosivora (SeqCode)]